MNSIETIVLIIILFIILIAVLYYAYISKDNIIVKRNPNISEEQWIDEHDPNYDSYDHKASALLLSCMDYRLIDPTVRLVRERESPLGFDYFILAGASLGVVNPTDSNEFTNWKQVFTQHIDLALQLHNIKKVIVVEHMDCGAYKYVFGQEMTADDEYDKHIEMINSLQQIVKQSYPQLEFSAYIMHLDGVAEEII